MNLPRKLNSVLHKKILPILNLNFYWSSQVLNCIIGYIYYLDGFLKLDLALCIQNNILKYYLKILIYSSIVDLKATKYSW